MKIGYRPGPIARSSMQTLAVYGLRLGTQVTLLFLVARYLGPSQFGEFAAIAALAVGLGTLSSFGLGFLVLGESAKLPERGQALLAQAAPATLLSAVLLGPLYFWLCRVALESDASSTVLVLIGFSELFLVPLVLIFSQRLQGLGKIARSQALAMTPIAMRLAAILACMMMAPTVRLEAYASAYFAASLVSMLFAIWAVKEVAVIVNMEMPTASRIKAGSPYALMKFTAINPSELDKALALRLLPTAEAGIYALAARGLSMATMPVVAMVVSSQPRLFRETGNGTAYSRRLIFIVLFVAGLVGIGAGLLLAGFAAPGLEWLMGHEFAGTAEAMRMLAWAAPFMALRFAAGGVLIPLEKPLIRSGIELLGLGALIGLGLIIGSTHGISGLIVAVVSSEAFMALLFCIYLIMAIRPHRARKAG